MEKVNVSECLEAIRDGLKLLTLDEIQQEYASYEEIASEVAHYVDQSKAEIDLLGAEILSVAREKFLPRLTLVKSLSDEGGH